MIDQNRVMIRLANRWKIGISLIRMLAVHLTDVRNVASHAVKPRKMMRTPVLEVSTIRIGAIQE